MVTVFFQNNMHYVMYFVNISIACIEELRKKKTDNGQTNSHSYCYIL